MTAPTDAALRLDKWLWFARLCKTRSLAQKLIERGQATLNGAPVDKSTLVQAGDRLTLLMGQVQRTLVVTAVGTRRGPAEEARGLYVEKEPPQRLPPGEGAPPLRPFR